METHSPSSPLRDQIGEGSANTIYLDFSEIMEITLTPWQLVGTVIGIVLGSTTIVSLLITAGIRIGKFATRDDLDRTSARSDKKISDEVATLDKKIGDEVAALDKRIDHNVARLEAKIDDNVARLEAKIGDEVAALHRKIDDNQVQVLLAIQNLGNRLENAILEHTHDEDGVAVFRRHPQMDAAN